MLHECSVLAADWCASNATGSVPCPAATSTCPFLPTDATCTALAGPCSGDQVCNGQLKNPDTNPSPESTGLQDQQDSTVGVCITPVAAGSSCKAGTDMCNVYSDFASMYCPASKCPLARPDMCSDGGSGSLSCPGAADEEHSTCTPVASDGICLPEDDCTSPQFCTGTGSTPGKCVTPVPAGAVCNQAAGSTAADRCLQSANGVPQFCNAIGSASGVCTNAVSAGAACTKNVVELHAHWFLPAESVLPMGIAPVFSNASSVPTVESVARLGDYATTDLFNAAEKARFISTMEANIMAKLNTVSNVTITKVSPGSINVANSVAFTGADSNVAKANQDAFASLLGSTDGVTSIYGTTFGAVTVSQVTQTTSPNPSVCLNELSISAVHSGAATFGMAWTLGVSLAVAAVGLIV
ncbi:hypothetical protein ABBQ38_002800 [Trebouxia sp. C0009 RCD-2024]